MRNEIVERIDAHLARESRRSAAGAVIGLIAWILLWGLALINLNIQGFILFSLGGLAMLGITMLEDAISGRK